MPDIAMCTNATCPKATKCYRHEAIPNDHRQSYANFQYTDDGCDNFWPMTENGNHAMADAFMRIFSFERNNDIVAE